MHLISLANISTMNYPGTRLNTDDLPKELETFLRKKGKLGPFGFISLVTIESVNGDGSVNLVVERDNLISMLVRTFLGMPRATQTSFKVKVQADPKWTCEEGGK